MDKVKLFESRFKSLAGSYIKSYKGKEPIINVLDNLKVEIEPSFLDHLPLVIRERVSILVNLSNAS